MSGKRHLSYLLSYSTKYTNALHLCQRFRIQNLSIQNCTSLTIEGSPTRTSTPYHRSRKFWYSVPYPSSFHWWTGIKDIPWVAGNNIVPVIRPLVALFIGSIKTANTNSNVLRRKLKNQCDLDPACQWHQTAHKCNGVVNYTDQMLMFRKAKYCPAPPGDRLLY